MPELVVDSLRGRVVAQPRMFELLLPHNPRKYAKSRRDWEAIVAEVVYRADHRTGAITTTHAVLGAAAAARVGRSRPFAHDTVARVIACLIAAGVLVCPDGLGGKSRVAFGGGRNQAPTYFVIDPALACADIELRTPQSHDSETVLLRGGTALYKGPIRPKFAGFDPNAVPATPTERRWAAEWLRAQLHVGAVPNWRMAAMMAKQFTDGLSPWQVFRRVTREPDGSHRRPLPIGDVDRAAALARSPHSTVADALLGMIGKRLSTWRGIQPAPRAARPVPSAALPMGPRTAPRCPDVLAAFERLGLRAGALR